MCIQEETVGKIHTGIRETDGLSNTVESVHSSNISGRQQVKFLSYPDEDQKEHVVTKQPNVKSDKTEKHIRHPEEAISKKIHMMKPAQIKQLIRKKCRIGAAAQIIIHIIRTSQTKMLQLLGREGKNRVGNLFLEKVIMMMKE